MKKPRPTTAATTTGVAFRIVADCYSLGEVAFQISGIKTNSRLGRRSWQGRRKKQKSNPSVTATPIVVTASSPHETVTKAAVTPAPGGGKGLVWVNTSSHVYHYQKSRWYGKTKQGQYMTEEQAKEDGNRPARSSE
jgi:hypothetical protein